MPPGGKGDLLGRAMAFAKDGSFGDAITFFHSWQLLQLDRLAQIELQKENQPRLSWGIIRITH